MTRGRRITAARYLRTLATVEKLAFLGNDSEVRRLLAGGIDPVEARDLADELELEQIGAVNANRAHGVVAVPVYPDVIHGNDNWSRKVVCS